MISSNLKDAGFIATQPGSKLPLAKRKEDWNTKILNYEEANKELEKGNNIAIVGGVNGFILIDDDSRQDKLVNAFNDLMQPTYYEESITGGKHLIYRADGWIPTKDDNFKQDGLGEFRCHRMYMLIAPSKAKDEKKGIMDVRPYKILEDHPVVYIGREDLQKIKSQFLGNNSNDSSEKLPDISRSGKEMSEVCKMILKGYDKIKVFEEMKLFTKWNTQGESYREHTYNSALDFCMSVIKKREHSKQNDEKEIQKLEEESWKEALYYDKDLKNFERPKQEEFVGGLIPKASIGMFCGYSGTRKTYFSLALALDVASGKSFLDNFPVERKLKVLFIDEENGKIEIDKRIKAIKNARGMNGDDLDIAYISFFNSKFDMPSKQKRISKFIEEFRPDLVFVDCLQRTISFDVDKDNQKISDFMTGFVRPIVNKTGCSFIFLHHFRKRDKQQKFINYIDEIRGGSELQNYCRFIFGLIRPGRQLEGTEDQIILKQLKMSNAPAVSDKVISFSGDVNQLQPLIIKYEGEAQEVLATEVLCADSIKEWVIDNNLTEFKTKEVEEAQPGGYKRTTVSQALKILVQERFLTKEKRGLYKIAKRESEPKTNETKLDDFNAEDVS